MAIKAKNMIQVNEIRQDNYFGIELDDIWFNKLGFSKKVLKTKTYYTNGHVELEKGNKRSGCYFLRGWKGYHKGLKYVHELQSLYFNLIGEELTESI